MIVTVSAQVVYACFLNKEQADQVKDYAKSHSTEYYDMTLEEAVMEMYSDPDIDFELYKDSSESDFSTEEVLSVSEED